MSYLYRYNAILICITCLVLSCTGKNSGTVFESSYTLDLDKQPVTDIVIGDEHRINLSGQDDLTSAPWYIAVTDQVIFLNDRMATPLRIIDKETHEVVKTYGKGRGPGDFSFISGISANSRHVMVADMSNSRNTYFNHLGGIDSMVSISAPFVSDYTSVFAVNDSMFTSESSNPDYLIQLNSLYRDENPVFLKERVIPLGYQPGVYNWPIITISDQYLAFSISGIPIITIADLSGRERFSMAVSSKEISRIENPPVKPVETSEAIRVLGVFTVLKIIGDRLFIVTTGSILNIIEVDFDDPDRSRIMGRFRFMEQDESGQLNVFSNVWDLDYDGNDLYVTPMRSESIYRIPFAGMVDP